MSDEVSMKVIAHIRTGFSDKFGIPRQSNLVEGMKAQIVFEEEYRDPSAVRGIEAYSHLWLLWSFSENRPGTWSPTVRPPKLGGNRRMGVFATRSPYRPNAIGLSSVRLEKVEIEAGRGPVLYVSGADLLDGTPIFDIKPYLAYTDSHPDATGGFSVNYDAPLLTVEWETGTKELLPAEYRDVVRALLEQDPRPGYQEEPERVYGMTYAGYDVHFRVDGDVLTVCGIEKKA